MAVLVGAAVQASAGGQDKSLLAIKLTLVQPVTGGLAAAVGVLRYTVMGSSGFFHDMT